MTMPPKQHLVITAVGPDRVGLVGTITQFLLKEGCNIEDSMMAVFAGEFTSAGIGIAVVFAVNNSTRVIESLKRLNLQDAITPMHMIDLSTYLIRGQMPWNGIAFSFALSLLLSAWAWKVTIARDF